MTALRAAGPLKRRRRGRGRERDGGRSEWPLGAEVSVDDVAKTYGQIRALSGVSLRVQPGEWVTVTGPSGSGKSTLLSLIGSLDVPDAGTIHVGSEPVPEPRDAIEFRRHVVGFMFQDNLLLPYLTAQSNVETALLATGLGRRERHQRSAELLAEVALEPRAQHLPSELSGGERQRVALARALANRPRLLLADEPTGALDSASSRRALDLLGAMRRRHGMTLIVVSHDPTVAERADRVIHLVDGQIESERLNRA
jgi:putative ABC transport system ATP-binding protein